MELKNWVAPRLFGDRVSEEVEEGMFTAVGDPENPDLVESKIEDDSHIFHSHDRKTPSSLAAAWNG